MTKKAIHKVKTPEMICRALSIAPKTVNQEERTFEVTFSKGTRGRRSPWFSEDYYEELSMDSSHVRMDRINNGAPFLQAHNGYSLSGVVGVVERAWVDGGEGKALIRMSKREEADKIFQDIQDGILRNISVGYSVHKYEEQARAEDGLKVFRAVDWEPHEISVVPMGFDDSAKIRSAGVDGPEKPDNLESSEKDERAQEEKVETQQESIDMTDQEKKAAEEKAQQERALLKDEAAKSERARGQEIVKIARSLKLSEDFAQKHVNDGTELEKFRALAIDEKAKAEEKIETVPVNTGGDKRNADMKLAIRDSILHRGDPTKYKVEGDAAQFAGLSMSDCARALLETGGVNTKFMSPSQIVERAMSTSDFPELLADVINKSLRDSYQEAPQTFQPFTRQVKVKDFKQISRTNLGDAPALEKVTEHGSVKTGKISENAEKYSVDTYAKKLKITRKTIINDDLEAMVRLPGKFGIAARDLESDLAWGKITANGAMSDSIALFHASHGNLTTGAAAISVTSVGVLWSKMRKQVGLDNRKINIAPQYLVAPVALETVGLQFLEAIVAAQDSNTNPYKKKLQLVTEPRLDDVSAAHWYLFSAIGLIDMLEMATLQGSNGPMITSSMLSLAEGMEVECVHDVGVGVIDFRGFQKQT